MSWLRGGLGVGLGLELSHAHVRGELRLVHLGLLGEGLF
jgi:hypothetical protein